MASDAVMRGCRRCCARRSRCLRPIWPFACMIWSAWERTGCTCLSPSSGPVWRAHGSSSASMEGTRNRHGFGGSRGVHMDAAITGTEDFGRAGSRPGTRKGIMMKEHITNTDPAASVVAMAMPLRPSCVKRGRPMRWSSICLYAAGRGRMWTNREISMGDLYACGHKRADCG